MNPAKNNRLGRHYGPTLVQPLEGFDTCESATFDTLAGAGIEPRKFAPVVAAALAEAGLPPDRFDMAPPGFWLAPWPLA